MAKILKFEPRPRNTPEDVGCRKLVPVKGGDLLTLVSKKITDVLDHAGSDRIAYMQATRISTSLLSVERARELEIRLHRNQNGQMEESRLIKGSAQPVFSPILPERDYGKLFLDPINNIDRDNLLPTIRTVIDRLCDLFPKTYIYRNVSLSSYPSENEIIQIDTTVNQEKAARAALENEMNETKKRLQSREEEEEGPFYLWIFVGNREKIAESTKASDIDLIRRAETEGLRYCEWRNSEYDGPTYTGSYIYKLSGSIFGVPLKGAKLDGHALNRLGKFIEDSEGYSVETRSRPGAYGGRSYDLNISTKTKNPVTSLTKNSCRNDFNLGKRPIVLPGEELRVITPDVVSRRGGSVPVTGKAPQHQGTEDFGGAMPTDVTDTHGQEPPRGGSESDNAPDGISYSITRNQKLSGIEIKFEAPPGKEVCAKLYQFGFRWSWKKQIWYKKDVGETDAKIGSIILPQ